jgi:hypothetical protein
VAALAAAARGRLKEFKPTEWPPLFWGLATQGHLDLPLFQELSTVCVLHEGRLGPHEIAMSLWSCALVRFWKLEDWITRLFFFASPWAAGKRRHLLPPPSWWCSQPALSLSLLHIDYR